MDLQVAVYKRTAVRMTLPAGAPFRRRGDSAEKEAALQPSDGTAIGMQLRRFGDIVNEPFTSSAEEKGEW